jgi:hypothetical protein
MHDVVGVRKLIAAEKIMKCFRVYRLRRRAKRKYAATPVIATFLRELKLTMEGTQYHVRLFCKKITILQRNWRKFSALSHKYYQMLNEAWCKVYVCVCAYTWIKCADTMSVDVSVCTRDRMCVIWPSFAMMVRAALLANRRYCNIPRVVRQYPRAPAIREACRWRHGCTC